MKREGFSDSNLFWTIFFKPEKYWVRVLGACWSPFFCFIDFICFAKFSKTFMSHNRSMEQLTKAGNPNACRKLPSNIFLMLISLLPYSCVSCYPVVLWFGTCPYSISWLLHHGRLHSMSLFLCSLLEPNVVVIVALFQLKMSSMCLAILNCVFFVLFWTINLMSHLRYSISWLINCIVRSDWKMATLTWCHS